MNLCDYQFSPVTSLTSSRTNECDIRAPDTLKSKKDECSEVV